MEAIIAGFKPIVGDHIHKGGNFFSFLCPNPKLAPKHAALYAQNVMQFFKDKGFALRYLGPYNLEDVIRISMPGDQHMKAVSEVFQELGDKARKLPVLKWNHFKLPGVAMLVGALIASIGLMQGYLKNTQNRTLS